MVILGEKGGVIEQWCMMMFLYQRKDSYKYGVCVTAK